MCSLHHFYSFPLVTLRAADDSEQNENESISHSVSENSKMHSLMPWASENTHKNQPIQCFSCQSYTEVSSDSEFYELSLIPIPEVHLLNTSLMTVESMVEYFYATKM